MSNCLLDPIFYKRRMDLANKYPAISDLRRKARRRIPHFMWE